MAEGRRRDEWSRAAALMALLAECHRNPEKRKQPYRPDDFDPTRPKVKGGGLAVPLRELRHVFAKPRGNTPCPSPSPTSPA